MPLDPLELVGGLAIGTGLGGAISDTVNPRLQSFKNGQWAAHPDKPLEAAIAAAVAAENYDTYQDMVLEGSFTGLDSARFLHLYDVTLTAPGLGELLAMLRRETINPGNFTHGLRKAKFEPMWDDALTDLRKVYLSPDILAVMLQRNVIPNQGQLPGVDLSTTGLVPRFPHVPIDAYAMAKTFGWSQDQLDAQTRIQGLPPGMDLVARMVFRNLVGRGDFNLAAEQSNRRVEWADFEFDGYRQILTAEQYAELQLRGYLTADERRNGTQLHGMRDAHSDLLYDVLGRGLSLHAAFIAERRGGVFKGPTDAIPDWAMFMLQRGNLRPEVYNLAWAGRHSYPSAFVVRALLQGGAITEGEGETIFLDLGWPDWLATKVAQHYAPSGAAVADPHVTKAENHEWTVAQTSYINGESDSTAVEPTFAALGVPAVAQASILASWDRTRALVRKKITPAQIKKAYKEAAVNAATGAAWTKAEAIDALVQWGYAVVEAESFLNI